MPRQSPWRAPLTPIAEEPPTPDDSFAMTPRPQHQDPRPLKKSKRDLALNADSGSAASSPRALRAVSRKTSRESLDGDYATPPGYASPPVTGEVLELRHSESFESDRDGSASSLRESSPFEQRHPLVEDRRLDERDELEMEMDAMGADAVDEGTADSAGVILGSVLCIGTSVSAADFSHMTQDTQHLRRRAAADRHLYLVDRLCLPCSRTVGNTQWRVRPDAPRVRGGGTRCGVDG